MAVRTKGTSERREPLSRERVLSAAVALADVHGVEAVTMRRLAQELGVEAMSLYNHVGGKDDVLVGMIDVVMQEIAARAGEVAGPARAAEWKRVVRERFLAARAVQLRHPWAHRLFQARATMTPTVLHYFDSLVGALREGGFSIDLAHHAMHALGGHALGYTEERFVTGAGDLGPEVAAIALQRMAGEYPHLTEMMKIVDHDAASTLGVCDDQFEFEFSLDLILDGLDRLRKRQPAN